MVTSESDCLFKFSFEFSESTFCSVVGEFDFRMRKEEQMVFLVGSHPFQKVETIREIFVWRMLLVFFSGSLNDCIVFFFNLKNTI